MVDSESDDASAPSSGPEGAAATAEAAAHSGGSEADPGSPLANLAGNDAELREYGLSLGVDLAQESDADLKPVVLEAFAAPLPSSWTEHMDEEGRVYFFNQVSQESSWIHPMDNVFKEVLELIQTLRRDSAKCTSDGSSRVACAVQAHLELCHHRALDQLDGWSGPYSSEGGQYYYNAASGVSAWESPGDELQAELALRQRILHRFLLQRDSASAEGTSSAALGGAVTGVFGADGDGMLLPRLPLNLAAAPGGGPKSPNSARSFCTARSARSVRSAHSPMPSARRLRSGGEASTLGSPARGLSCEEMMPGISTASVGSVASASAVHPPSSSSRPVSTSSASSVPQAASSAAAAGAAMHRGRGHSECGEDSLEITFGHTEGLVLPKFGMT